MSIYREFYAITRGRISQYGHASRLRYSITAESAEIEVTSWLLQPQHHTRKESQSSARVQ